LEEDRQKVENQIQALKDKGSFRFIARHLEYYLRDADQPCRGVTFHGEVIQGNCPPEKNTNEINYPA